MTTAATEHAKATITKAQNSDSKTAPAAQQLAGAGALVDRPELCLQEILVLEGVLWSKIRQEDNLDKVNSAELQLLGKLHRSAKKLSEKINQAGRI